MKRTTRIAIAIVMLLVASARAESRSNRIDRLIGLGRIWAETKFFHPKLAYEELEWDGALIAAIPKAEAAKTRAEYRAAIATMLDVLHDPLTHVIDDSAPPAKVELAERQRIVEHYGYRTHEGTTTGGYNSKFVTVDVKSPIATRIVKVAGVRAQIRIGEALGPALPDLVARNDRDYADQPYPSRELRMLAVIKVWAVCDTFWPYRAQAKDWDAVLREMLPRVESARDRAAYIRVVREMGARTGDAHVGVWSTATESVPDRGYPPVTVQLVEGKLAVMRIFDRTGGIAVGDVIETIDGKPVAAVLADRRMITSGSSLETRNQSAAPALLVGDAGTTVKLGVIAAGKRREVALRRETGYLTKLNEPPTTPHWSKLANDVGYADLSTLTVAEVAPMFAELSKTRAIVFDMRGYPKGTAWAIAPIVNTRHARDAAVFLAPIVRGDRRTVDTFVQPIPARDTSTPLYAGKVVVLVDHHTMSQAEHTCLFLAEAAGAVFVGSPTAGADGDLTVMRLPGALRMSLSGQEVRHVDGRRLQKVGIVPDVLVRPTLAGVRAGKDEILERALAVLHK